MAAKEDLVEDPYDYLDLVTGEVDLFDGDDYVSYEVVRDRLELTIHSRFRETRQYSWLLVPVAA